MIPTIEWRDGRVRILDQTLLPSEETYIDTDDWRVVGEAIERLSVRGAPAIGVAAAMGVALAARAAEGAADVAGDVRQAIDGLSRTRPTAVNLFWALERMRTLVDRHATAPGPELAGHLEAEAEAIYRDDLELSRRMGRAGAELLGDGATVLTICNTGGLATAGLGTALAVVYAAHQAGQSPKVLAAETRPLLQGARLTTWELLRAQIDVTLLVDAAVAHALRTRQVDWVLSGADRIAQNGDTANKIGTYALALAARAHNVPFAVVAPYTTLDPACPSGSAIPIEERGADEVRALGGHPTAPPGVAVWNPAFDVTPAELISAIVTDRGVHRPPYAESLASDLARAGA